MRPHARFGVLALAAWLAGCGGGGDDKTAIALFIEINGSVPPSTVESITEAAVTVSVGTTTSTARVAVSDRLRDYDTSVRYVDDGTFSGMAVSVKLELNNAGGQAVFSETKTGVMVTAGDTVDLDYRFGDGVIIDAGPDTGGCPTPPACSGVADKACVSGTVVDFGTEAPLMNPRIELSVVDLATGTNLGTGTVDACGKFSTGDIMPPTGGAIGVALDDPAGGADDFKKTVSGYIVARGTVLPNETLRALSATLDASLSTSAGLCAGACTTASTFAGRGAAALFYRHARALQRNVRVTLSTSMPTKPSLVTSNVFYFTDNTAGKQTMINMTQTETTASGAALLAMPGTTAVTINGTGGLPGPNLSWKPRLVLAPPGIVAIVDVESTPHVCDPLMQLAVGCLNADDGCYPTPSMPGQNFCVHAGTRTIGTACTLFNDCEAAATCNATMCRSLCRVGGGAPSCTAPLTCMSIGADPVGVCK